MDRDGILKELEALKARVRELETGIEERDAIALGSVMKGALLENISDLAYVCDDHGNILYVNRVFERLAGCTPAEYAGKPFATLFSEADLKIANDAYERTLRGESPVYELAFVKTGIPCEYRNHPFYDDMGRIIGVLGTARDITDRKKALKDLEERDFLLTEAQRVGRIGSYVLDIQADRWTSSEVLDDIFGLSGDFERNFTTWVELLHPDDRDSMIDYFRTFVMGGRNDFDMEYRIVRKRDAAVRWVHGRGKLSFDRDGRPVGMIGTIQDITDKKMTEEKLQGVNRYLETLVQERSSHLSSSEARYRALVDIIPYGIHEVDLNGVITFCNAGWARMFGYAPSELTGRHIWDFADSDESRDALKATFKSVIEDRLVPIPYYNSEKKKDGSRIDTKIDWNYKYDESGELTGFVAVITDITEQKRIDDALKGSESMLNEAQRMARMGSWLMDVDNNLTQPSDEFLRIFDITRETVQKDPLFVIRRVHPEDRAELERLRDKALAGRRPTHVSDYRLLLADGTVRHVHSEERITYDAQGRPSLIAGTVHDVTETKAAEMEKERLQAQLLQSQKMEAIGTMAGGVAHDFNNIMTVVSSLVELMLQKTGQSDPFFKYLKPIRESCMRAVNLVQQLLIFSSKRPQKMSTLDLNETISDMMGFFEHLLCEDITIETDLKHDLWEISADRVRIEQVLTNLVLNSSEAMPQGGIVKVSSSNVKVGEKDCVGVPGATPGRYVCLCVDDSGHGIDPDVQRHIFEPFFTTKKAKNSGMGLAVVYGVVKDHNGWVTVDSKPGVGTSFKVFFPAAQAPAVSGRPSEAKSPEQGSGRRILLVEDEGLVRRSIAIVLEENGYVVFEAPDADGALKVFRRERGRFDLVLSDMIMPGQSGLQMASKLKEINPKVPVLLSSGYLDDKAQISEIIKSGFAFIQKPYDSSELLSAVEDTMSSNNTGPAKRT